jgi:hypothetical protein
MSIEPAGIGEADIAFHTPVFNSHVFLRLMIVKDGTVRFDETHTAYETAGGKDFTSEFNGAERKFL